MRIDRKKERQKQRQIEIKIERKDKILKERNTNKKKEEITS